MSGEPCPSVRQGYVCQVPAPHPTKHHRHERPDGTVGTAVLIWATPDLNLQPEYPEGTVTLDKWVVQSKDFTG